MKAILVIDMPNKCDDCDLRSFEGCPLTGNLWGERPIDCPLKRLPKKRKPCEYPDTVSFKEAEYHASGYNQCLKDILGETE